MPARRSRRRLKKVADSAAESLFKVAHPAAELALTQAAVLEAFLRPGPRAGERIRVLFLAYLPQTNASARHRAYKWVEALRPFGIDAEVSPPTTAEAFHHLFSAAPKRWHALTLWRRGRDLVRAKSFDVVIVQRELLGEYFDDLPIMLLGLRAANPRIIYDVDDAIYMLPPQARRARERWPNWMAKTRWWAHHAASRAVFASTEDLWRAAPSQSQHKVHVVPTLVDVEAYPVRQHDARAPVVLGWAGNGGNLSYLDVARDALAKVASRRDVVLQVVSNRAYEIPGVPTEFVPWTLERERDLFSTFDVGLMPLTDNPYTRSKAAFKLLQYMAAGVPSVASPVGFNRQVVLDGETGFLASDMDAWVRALIRLIDDPSLRARMGAAGRAKVEAEFSYAAWAPKIARIIREVAG